MKYHYLGTSGVVNETSSSEEWRERQSSAARQKHGRDRKKSPRWRGNQISLADLRPHPRESGTRESRLPGRQDGETLRLAAVNHRDVGLADKISFMIARPVRLVAASREEIQALFREFYGEESGSHAVDSMQQSFIDPSDRELSKVRHTTNASLAFIARTTAEQSSCRTGCRLAAVHPAKVRDPVSIPLLPWEIQACGFTSLRKASASWCGIPTARWR